MGHPDGPGILEIKTASYHSAQWEEGASRLPVSGTASARRHRPCPGGKWRYSSVVRILGFIALSVTRRRSGSTERGDVLQVTRANQRPEPDGPAGHSRAWPPELRDDGERPPISPDSPEFNQPFGSCRTRVRTSDRRRTATPSRRSPAARDQAAPRATGSRRDSFADGTTTTVLPTARRSPFRATALAGVTQHDCAIHDHPPVIGTESASAWPVPEWTATGAGEGRQLRNLSPPVLRAAGMPHPRTSAVRSWA